MHSLDRRRNYPGKFPGGSLPTRAGGAGQLTTDDIAEMMPDSLDLRQFMNALEKSLIQRALRATGGAQAETARKLGLSRGDVFYKLSKHNIRGAPV